MHPWSALAPQTSRHKAHRETGASSGASSPSPLPRRQRRQKLPKQEPPGAAGGFLQRSSQTQTRRCSSAAGREGDGICVIPTACLSKGHLWRQRKQALLVSTLMQCLLLRLCRAAQPQAKSQAGLCRAQGAFTCDCRQSNNFSCSSTARDPGGSQTLWGCLTAPIWGCRGPDNKTSPRFI